MDLLLYYAPGSCSRVPMIALEELGQPFEARVVAFMAGEHKTPDYLALNPAGKVPTLLADGRPIAQNAAIQLFLARSFPDAGLLPMSGDPYHDAALVSRLVWFSADLHPLVTRIRMPHFACDIAGGPERVREIAMAAMAAQLTPLDQELANRTWLLGDQWSVLDAYLFWVWFRITGAGFDVPLANIQAHYERMQSRPSVQRALRREADGQAQLEARGLAVPPQPRPV
jgi:glutathione S-transferase